MKNPLFFTLVFLLSPLMAQDELRFKNPDERPRQLSEEEQRKAQDYVHQGYLQKQKDEACRGSNKAACAGEEATVFGDADAMVPAVSKMYSVFTASTALGNLNFANDGTAAAEGASQSAGGNSGAASSGTSGSTGTTGGTAPAGSPGNATAGQGNANPPQQGNPEDNNPSKICDAIPVATEGGALVGQQMEQKQIDEGKAAPGTEQRENLFKVARSHETRSHTTIIQTTGFTTTAGCYVATGIKGHSDPKVLLKTAAAVGLAGFYGMKTMAHMDYAEKTKNLAKRLPGKGACNPITEPNCFCTEPSSQATPDFAPTCIAQPFRPRVAPGVIATSCVDSAQRADPNCECLKTQSCFDAQFVQFAAGMNTGVTKLDDTLAGVATISRGKVNRADVESANLARLARAKEFLNTAQLPPGLDPQELSAAQTKEAQALQRLGVPPRYARIFARLPPRPDLAARFSGGVPLQYNYNPNSAPSSYGTRSNALYFDEGGGNRRSSFSSRTPIDTGVKNGPAPANSETLTFAANAATNQADIHQDRDDVSLFKIISHRYLQTGIRSLDVSP